MINWCNKIRIPTLLLNLCYCTFIDCLSSPLQKNCYSKLFMNKKIAFPLFLALAVMIGIMIGLKINREARFNKPFLFNYHPDKYQTILNFISANYVDSVDASKIGEHGYEEVMQQLDPHSNYISAKDYNLVNEPLQGNFKGVGIEFFIVNDTVMVINTINGGPAEKAGVKKGDKIIKIEDTIIAGKKITSEKIFNKLRGESNTKVKITVLRNPNHQLKDITINRGEVDVKSVDVAYMIDAETGYIKINSFGQKTYIEFMENLDRMLNKEGMKKLIIDLRDNGGGYLDAATNILDELIDENKTLVYTKGRARSRHDYKCTKDGMFEHGKIALLVDEGSASASEIVAGALQDWDRASIIGRRTFGKGLVQEEYQLKDGSAIRITVARYYTPSGRCIQKPYGKGISDYSMEIYKRYKHGEFLHADSIHFADTVKYYTAHGKVVYGGGGIKPDYFVPADTNGINAVSSECLNKGFVQQFAYDWANDNSTLFNTFVDYKDFAKRFNFSAAQYASFIQYASKKGVKNTSSKLTADAAAYLQNQLKAFIAKAKWGSKGYYFVVQQQDPAFQKALQVLK